MIRVKHYFPVMFIVARITDQQQQFHLTNIRQATEYGDRATSIEESWLMKKKKDNINKLAKLHAANYLFPELCNPSLSLLCHTFCATSSSIKASSNPLDFVTFSK